MYHLINKQKQMAMKLAFIGSETKGPEIEATLVSLGGIKSTFSCTNKENIYFIGENYHIEASDRYVFEKETDVNKFKYKIFSIEEFKNKYPYRFGETVICKNKFIGQITYMSWSEENGDMEYIVSNEWTYKHILSQNIDYIITDDGIKNVEEAFITDEELFRLIKSAGYLIELCDDGFFIKKSIDSHIE